MSFNEHDRLLATAQRLPMEIHSTVTYLIETACDFAY